MLARYTTFRHNSRCVPCVMAQQERLVEKRITWLLSDSPTEIGKKPKASASPTQFLLSLFPYSPVYYIYITLSILDDARATLRPDAVLAVKDHADKVVWSFHG